MRHAWMILAHNNFALLERLVCFLDSENADIFLHIDKKAVDFDPARFTSLTRRSRVICVDRYDIAWGDFNMVEAELALLRAAVPGGYDYYHLLSGVDIPLKTRSEIEARFEKSPKINYVNFKNPVVTKEDLYRVRFYYPFQPLNIRKPALRRTLRNLSAGAQLVCGIDRTKKLPSGTVFQKGAQWFSITGDFAGYLLTKEDFIRSAFRRTYCPDEMFLQTVLINSPFRGTLPEHAFEDDYRACLRYIDWKRGNPYVFQEKDLSELLALPEDYLFARKADGRNALPERLYAALAERDASFSPK